MSAEYTLTHKDGRQFVGVAKWTPQEFEVLTGAQLADAFSEMAQFANYCETNFYTPIDDLSGQISKIEGDYQDAKTGLLSYGIAVAVCLVLWIITKVADKNFLAFMCTFLLIGAVVMAVISLIKFLAASKKEKTLPNLQAQLEQVEAAKEQAMYGTYVNQMATGLVALPNYYLTSAALSFMANAVRNHRANTVAQAVNLHEMEKQHLQTMRVMSQQLEAQQQAAAAAQQAAASAQAAADSAHTAAMNSYYDRNK
ncbi:MAG: hypothetical protein J6L88_07810 [Clostridia bacterium]|nr:hypothetical protein [Clostridia bacterium]